jgi:hypothetical protein
LVWLRLERYSLKIFSRFPSPRVYNLPRCCRQMTGKSTGNLVCSLHWSMDACPLAWNGRKPGLYYGELLKPNEI